MIPSLIGFLVVRALTFGPRLWCRHNFGEAPYNGETGLGLQVVQRTVP